MQPIKNGLNKALTRVSQTCFRCDEAVADEEVQNDEGTVGFEVVSNDQFFHLQDTSHWEKLVAFSKHDLFIQWVEDTKTKILN